MDSTWQHTDPDSHQYGREVYGDRYEFKEFDRNNYEVVGDTDEEEEIFIDKVFDDSTFWVEETINLSDYNEQEIDRHVSSYYGSLEGLKDECGDDWRFIAAECIFEQNSGLY